MSSSNAKHEFDALVKRLPFDINPAFYPPPTISLPDVNIPPPSDYKYDFKKELEAIEMYKEEQINNPELESTDSTQSHRPTVIDIISKVSYLSIVNSNNNSQSQVGTVLQGTHANSEASSASTTPVTNSLKYPDPASTAAAMLPTWTPPQLI